MRRRARIDATATELVKVAKQLGAQWLPWPGGPIDGLLLQPWKTQRPRVLLVDWKSSAKSPLTDKQKQLIADGWPLNIWSTPDEVIAGLR